MDPSRNLSPPRPTSGKEPQSRRRFLILGGTVVTGFSLWKASAPSHRAREAATQRIREIMNRYGSELGKARFVKKGSD